MKVKQVAYHRNGVSGVGFHAIRFVDDDGREMVAVVFDEDGYCAVLDCNLLIDDAVGVRFGENSWRGDRFEPELRQAIEECQSDGSIRLGPFANPNFPD